MIFLMKKKPAVKKTANDWLQDILCETGSGGVEQVPDGWKTLKEICEDIQLPESTVNLRLNKAMRLGKIQRKKFRVKSGTQITGVFHYFKA